MANYFLMWTYTHIEPHKKTVHFTIRFKFQGYGGVATLNQNNFLFVAYKIT